MNFNPGDIPRIKGFESFYNKCDEIVSKINEYPNSDQIKHWISDYINLLESYSGHLFKNRLWDAVEQIWLLLLSMDIFSAFVLGYLVSIYKNRAEIEKLNRLSKDVRINSYPKIKTDILDFVNDTEMKAILDPVHELMKQGNFALALNMIHDRIPAYPDENRSLFFRLTMKQITIYMLTGNEIEAWKTLTNLKVAYMNSADFSKLAEISMRQTELLKKMGKYPEAVITLISYHIYSDLIHEYKMSTVIAFTEWIQDSELMELIQKGNLVSIQEEIIRMISEEYEHLNIESIDLIERLRKLIKKTIKRNGGGEYDHSN